MRTLPISWNHRQFTYSIEFVLSKLKLPYFAKVIRIITLIYYKHTYLLREGFQGILPRYVPAFAPSIVTQ